MQDTCQQCGKPIPPGRRADAIYCSDSCKIKASRHRRKYTPVGLSEGELQTLATIRLWSPRTADMIEDAIKRQGVPKIRPVMAWFRKLMWDSGLSVDESRD